MEVSRESDEELWEDEQESSELIMQSIQKTFEEPLKVGGAKRS